MKKFLIILLFIMLCSCQQKQSYNNQFLTILNDYEYDESKIAQYQFYYEQTHNIIYAINKVNYPDFFSPEANHFLAITKNNLLLINTNYYLEQSYVPKQLVLPIDVDYIIKDQPITLDKTTYEAYLKLDEYMKMHNYYLTIFSGYRSFEYQEKLYQKNQNGFVAKPGASEHQSGYALDISLRTTGLTSYFDQTEEAVFLANNAYRFGFILRYPKDKTDITGYPYESWHYRYVGVDVATTIYKNNLTLEEYFYYYILL